MTTLPRWIEETTLKFVQEYRVRECLWNTKAVIYKNRNAREAAFQELEVVMGIEGFGVPEIKNKIKALRSTYSQELKKIKESKKSGSGTDSVYIPHVKWFQEMHAFLHCLDNKRQTQDNLSLETSTTNDISDLSDQESSLVDAGNERSTTRGESQMPGTSTSIPTPLNKKRKSNMEKVSTALRDLKKITNDVTKEPPMENEFLVFGKSVAAQLMKLSTRNALLAQEQIQSILTHLRIQELQAASFTPLPIVEPRSNYNSTTVPPLPSPAYSESYDSQSSTSNNAPSYTDIVSEALSNVGYNN